MTAWLKAAFARSRPFRHAAVVSLRIDALIVKGAPASPLLRIVHHDEASPDAIRRPSADETPRRLDLLLRPESRRIDLSRNVMSAPGRGVPVTQMRKHLAILSFILGAIGAPGCRREAAHVRADPRVIRLATGSPGAGYYPLGQALVRAYERELPDLHVAAFTTPGSIYNVEAIQRGDADLGFAFADVTYLAYAGRLEGSAFTRLRGIAVLQVNPIHLVVASQSSIRGVSGLRGHRVGFGPSGSGTAATAAIVLSAFGVDPRQVSAEYLPVAEAASAMKAGMLDAMFVDAGYPAGSVTAAATAGARLVAIDGPPVDRLRRDYPFMRLVAIPPGTYPRQRLSVHTIGVDNLLICSSDLDEESVYRLTTEFFAALPMLVTAQQSLRQINVAEVAATPIPLHEGAARYYRERELFR